jgi:hypothetical protein
MMKGKNMLEEDVQRLLASRKEAGLKIDPETAEVDWEYGQVMDPYGVYSDLPEECQQVGRQYFARSPGVTYGSTSVISRTKSVTPMRKT